MSLLKVRRHGLSRLGLAFAHACNGFRVSKRAASSSPSLSPTWAPSGGGRKRQRKRGRARRCFDDRLLEAVGELFWKLSPLTSAVDGRHLLLQWLARPMFLVSRVVDDRRCCRRKCHAGHTCIRRLVPLVKRASQTARFMLGARLNVYTGPIEGGGVWPTSLGRGREDWYFGSGNQTFGGAGQPSTSTVRVWVMMLRMKASHGTCSVRPCPHLRPPVFRADQPAPRRLPPNPQPHREELEGP